MKYRVIVLLTFLLINSCYGIGKFRSASAPQLKNIFRNLPTLETKRLILRAVRQEDAKDLHETYGDPEVAKYVPWSPDPDRDKTQYWVNWRLERYKQGLPTPWAMVRKEDKKVIGLCGFYKVDEDNACAEILSTLARKYWGHGFIPEAGRAIAAYAFASMDLNRIQALIHPDNDLAIKLLEKAGFHKVGLIPECLYYKGAYWDRVVFTLLKKDFLEQEKERLQPAYSMVDE